MSNRRAKRFKGHLLSAGIIVASTIFVLVGVEIGLSVWVYPEKKYIEPAFCSKNFSFIEDCSRPPPLFHFRIARLALFNAITNKASYKPRPFEKLSLQELEELSPWRRRLDQKLQVPWDKNSFIEYTYDEMGRRVGQLKNLAPKSKFMAFLGGSWVHGDWLPYDQTLPGQMEKRMPNFKVYNYGIPGGGLQDAFIGSHVPSFLNGIPEKKGIFVYVYKWMHLDRLRPSFAYTSGRLSRPIAEYAQGRKLGFGGSQYQAYPVLAPALAFADISGIGRFMNLTEKSAPKWNLKNFFCDMIAQTRDRLENSNKSAKFVVLLYAHEPQHESWPFPLRCLEKNKIPYFAPFLNSDLVETSLPDAHPDGKAHGKAADRFSVWIDNLSKL